MFATRGIPRPSGKIDDIEKSRARSKSSSFGGTGTRLWPLSRAAAKQFSGSWSTALFQRRYDVHVSRKTG
jgi:hypothetical protein